MPGGGGMGWKWGNTNKCWASKKDAIKQGYAENPTKFKQEMNKSKSEMTPEDIAYAKEVMYSRAGKSFEEMMASALFEQTVAYIPEHERAKIPDEDFAGENRSFPIRNEMDVMHAAHLIGHAPDPSKVKKRIIEIAKRKGLSLPDAWK